MKNFHFIGYAARLVVVAVFSFVLFSCSKEEIPLPKSDKAELVSVAFTKAANPSLTSDAQAYRNGMVFYITLPEGVAINSLKPDLIISPGATATINNVPVNTTQSSVDFSGVVKVVVTSESGKNLTYKILVKNGRKDLDGLIYSFMTRYSIPGMSFAISRNEQIVYASGVGLAVVESDTRTTPGHLFRLASVSKQFTTLCIMKLYEAGKLNITDKVFGQGGLLEQEYSDVTISPMASRVTVQHLLQHTSGWKSNPDPMFTSSFSGQSLDQRIKYVLTSPQVEPGTEFSYFNMGFGMLGKIIEKLSGKKFEEYLKEVLLEAGISDIHVGKDRNGRRANEVVYYSQDGTNGYGNDMDVIAAAGGVIASTEQMLRLLFHVDGLPGVADIITPQTRNMMLTPCPVYNRYALGWRMNHTYYPESWYHSGNLAGTATMWVMGPGVNCVILCNSRSYISGFDDELYGLLRDVFNIAKSATW